MTEHLHFPQFTSGVLLGPALADAVPFIDALQLIGKLGILLLVLEAGLEVDFIGAMSIAPRALGAAVTGVILPVIGSLGVVAAFGGSVAQGLAAGAAIAPTSLGFSSQLLSDTGLLSLPLGRLIAAAAVLDDVISLVLLAEVQALADDTASTWDFIFPVLGSAGAIAVGSALVWLLHCKGALLEQQAEKLRDMLPNSAASTPTHACGDRGRHPSGPPTSSAAPLSLGRAATAKGPPARCLSPQRRNSAGNNASIAPAQHVARSASQLSSGRADAHSTMETVQLDGGSVTAVSDIVTNTSVASGVSVASQSSTVHISSHVAVPVTAESCVSVQPGVRVAQPAGTHSSPRTSSVHLHTVTLPTHATNTRTLPQVITRATALMHTSGMETVAAAQPTGRGGVTAAQVTAQRQPSADATRSAATVTPMARMVGAPSSVDENDRAALSVSDHFSTHDGMATVDSAAQHGQLLALSAREGNLSAESAARTSASQGPSGGAADSLGARAGPRAPRPRHSGTQLHAVSSGQEGDEGDVVTEEHASMTSAAVQSLQSAAVGSPNRSVELLTGPQQPQPAQPATVRLPEEVVTMNSDSSAIMLPGSQLGGQGSSEQSYRAGGSPVSGGTSSPPLTPNATAEFPAAAPRRASHSLAAMRLSTINSESNMLTRTADSDAMAAASQRALRLMSSLHEEQAQSVGRVLLVVLFALAAALAAACSAVRSSDLMGVFFAGVAFSGISSVKSAWKRHVQSFVPWGAALFFTCTVGFAVPPVVTLFTAAAALRGVCLLLVAVLGKLALGLWAYPLSTNNALLLGWAMNGRGEFSFLITQQATESGLLSDELGAAVVWAVVLSTVAAPIGFRFVAKRAGLHKRE